jgi:hypothetical protein
MGIFEKLSLVVGASSGYGSLYVRVPSLPCGNNLAVLGLSISTSSKCACHVIRDVQNRRCKILSVSLNLSQMPLLYVIL